MSSAGESSGSRVILWCVPRTISSALTKCLGAIQDIEIHFEPYTYSYVARTTHKVVTGEDIPKVYEGNEEAIDKVARIVSQEAQSDLDPKRLTYTAVKNLLETSRSKHVFVKDMGMGVTDDTYKFIPDKYKHTFLIRNPIRSINSYRKAIYTQFSKLGLLEGEAADEQTYDIERDDKYCPPGCFIKELYDVWRYIRENIDSNPIVIDADDLLAKPAEVLKAYCEAVGFPYSDSLLEWDASIEPLKAWKAPGDNLVIDLVNFYGTAMRSSKFLPASKFPSHESLTPDVIRSSERVMKYFDEMYESRLIV